jgi:hypothetical protein
MAGVTAKFIADAEEELERKKKEKAQLLDQLALYDVKLDQYDVIIENMDRSILPLINEINVEIDKVKAAYDARLAAGCVSNLAWVLIGEETRFTFRPGGGSTNATFTTYECMKNPEVGIFYGRGGAKYYRRPKNQDYGSNIIAEFFGSISVGNTNLAIVRTGLAGTTGILLGDIITDDIDNPTVFGVDDLPTIVGFGISTVLIDTQMFGGITRIGSVLIGHSGIGATASISIGTTASESNNFIATPGNTIIGTSFLPQSVLPGTTIVGFGTTTVDDEIWDYDANGGDGGYVPTSSTIPALIVSQPATATGETDFVIGITTNYKSFFLSTIADATTDLTNFTVIRQTQSVLDEFDPTNNPIDPVTIGIMNNSSAGYGHTLVRVGFETTTFDNKLPPGPFQWREVLGEYDPEPECGNGVAEYYFGNLSWPGFDTFNYETAGTFPNQTMSLLGSSFTYATEGTKKVIITYPNGAGLEPASTLSTTNVSPTNPTFAGCNALTNALSTTEAARDAVIARNQPIIDKTISEASQLRLLRDNLESIAFCILQGRAAADAEIVRLTNAIKVLQNTDFDKYEPVQARSANKLSSNTVGIPTT